MNQSLSAEQLPADPQPAAVETPAQTAPGFARGRVFLKARRARPFYGRHPWVLDSAIDRCEGAPADGDVVDLLADNGKFVARGIFNSASRIRVRLYTWSAADALVEEFWDRRVASAIELREQLGYNNPRGAARLIFSEADNLSGLIVDRYAQWLSVQITARATAARLNELTKILVDRLQPRGIFLRTEKGISQAENIEIRDGLHWGESPVGPVFIEENGLRYGVDLAEGQKTGFYLDQRENRRAAATYFTGRRVLDMFCYSGGFSLNAARLGRAHDVWGFDSSEKAVVLARANAELNGIANARFDTADCFAGLETLAARREQFGAAVVDPPKFARSRNSVTEALRAYHHLNRLALSVLEPGGILVTCSCSGHVTREDFLYMLVGVAQQSRRGIQILETRGAAPDHPVSATCLESEYLKCYICRVL
jgi:23S rRNA (cytosine1962-C5)-methyltransferase